MGRRFDGRHGGRRSDWRGQPVPARHPLPACLPDRARPVLGPRRCPAVPAHHVRPGLRHELHPAQRPGPALRAGRLHHPHWELPGAGHRRMEHVLRAHPALHRRGPALPSHGSSRARRVVRLGARRLGHRRGHGHAPHRDRHRTDRGAGLGPHVRAARAHGLATRPAGSRLERPPGRDRLVSSGLGHRPFHHPARGLGRVLVPGRRAVPAPRQPDHDVGAERHRRHGGRRAELVRVSFLTHLANLFSTSGTETAWILAAVSVVIGLGPWWRVARAGSSQPARWSPCSVLDRGPRSRGQRLQRLGHRSQYGADRRSCWRRPWCRR